MSSIKGYAQSEAEFNCESELMKKLNMDVDQIDDIETILPPESADSSLYKIKDVGAAGDYVNSKVYCESEAASSFGDGGGGDEVYYSDFYEDDAAFDEVFQDQVSISEESVPFETRQKCQGGTSLTFSKNRVMEIERANEVLFDRIRHVESSLDTISVKRDKNQRNQVLRMKSAAEFNRAKKYEQIDFENTILKRKLDKIARSKSTYANYNKK